MVVELDEERRALERLGMVSAAIRTYGAELLEVPTVTMELTVGAGNARDRGKSSQRALAAAASLPGLDPRATYGWIPDMGDEVTG